MEAWEASIFKRWADNEIKGGISCIKFKKFPENHTFVSFFLLTCLNADVVGLAMTTVRTVWSWTIYVLSLCLGYFMYNIGKCYDCQGIKWDRRKKKGWAEEMSIKEPGEWRERWRGARKDECKGSQEKWSVRRIKCRSNARLQQWVKDMEISNWRDPVVDALSLAGKRKTGWVVAGEDMGFRRYPYMLLWIKEIWALLKCWREGNNREAEVWVHRPGRINNGMRSLRRMWDPQHKWYI